MRNAVTPQFAARDRSRVAGILGRAAGMTLWPVLALLSLAPAQAQHSRDQALVAATMQAFVAAYNARDARAVASLYAPDAVLFPVSRAPVVGQQAIAQFYDRAFAAALGGIELEILEITVDGDTAVEIGQTLGALPAAGGGSQRVVVRYLHVWRRAGPEAWLLHRDIYQVLTQMQ